MRERVTRQLKFRALFVARAAFNSSSVPQKKKEAHTPSWCVTGISPWRIYPIATPWKLAFRSPLGYVHPIRAQAICEHSGYCKHWLKLFAYFVARAVFNSSSVPPKERSTHTNLVCVTGISPSANISYRFALKASFQISAGICAPDSRDVLCISLCCWLLCNFKASSASGFIRGFVNNKGSTAMVLPLLLVEPTGIEPVSEDRLIQPSP